MKLNDAIKEYAETALALKRLETKIESLKPVILSRMRQNSYKGDYGTLSRYEKRTWSYSEEVQAMNEAIKQKKAEEEEKGIAKPAVAVHLRYNPPKADILAETL